MQRGGTPPHQKECHAHISVLPVNVCLSVWFIVAAAGYKANFRVLVTVIKTDSIQHERVKLITYCYTGAPWWTKWSFCRPVNSNVCGFFRDAGNLCMWQKVETCPGTRGIEPRLNLKHHCLPEYMLMRMGEGWLRVLAFRPELRTCACVCSDGLSHAPQECRL